MIVLDASAAVDLLLETPEATTVRAALSVEPRAHAPELVDPEVLQAIRRWEARGWLETSRADAAVRDLSDLPLVRHRHGGLRSRAWELRQRCSAYDAIYVTLAEALDATLITTDERLKRAARGLVEVAH